MLLDFTIKNYLSFKNEVSLNMLAAKTVKENEKNDSKYVNTWSIPETETKVLKSAAIYGANGSGKSNLVQAMAFFREIVLASVVDENIVNNSNSLNFRLEESNANEPVCMQIIFIADKMKYRYGFELFDSKVVSEWLFMQATISHSKESYCFIREKNTVTVNARTFKGARGINAKTRGNALFLSTCAQFNVEIAMIIKEWFRKRFNVISGLNDPLAFTANQFMHNNDMHRRILDFIKLIDLGIEDIDVKEKAIESNAFGSSATDQMEQLTLRLAQGINPKIDKLNRLEINAQHALYNGDKKVGQVSLPFQMESLGTNKLFAFLGPWFDTLNNGGVLVVDEFGASLHTQLSIELINLFHSRMNQSGSQLIMTTHDTNLLRRDLLRRDQIWFVEKSNKGCSDLYSLVEYKMNQATSVRNDASFGKDYLLGRYGAIPYFGNIDKFIDDYGKEEHVRQ